MNASDWEVCADPQKMLEHVLRYRKVIDATNLKDERHQIVTSGPSDRQLRLVACAAARLMENHPPHPERTAVIERCEHVADGRGRGHGWQEELIAARESIQAVWGWTWCCTAERIDVGLRETLIQMRGNSGNFYRQEEVADILRDIIGNPWHPITLSPAWRTPTVVDLAEAAYRERPGRECQRCRGNPGKAVGIFASTAEPGYGDPCAECRGTGRIADGTLDPVRLMILADALEENGLEDDSVLFHLRGEFGCNLCEGAGYKYISEGPSMNRVKCKRCNGEGLVPHPPHYPGCAALDAILGRS